jgi:hypothetical protein
MAVTMGVESEAPQQGGNQKPRKLCYGLLNAQLLDQK